MKGLRTKKQKILTMALIGLMLVFLVAYFARGWLRGPVVSWGTTKLYAPQIDQTFEDHIEPINPILKALGILLDNKGPGDDSKAACYDGNFHFLQETVTCSRYANNHQQALPRQLDTKWPKESEKIKDVLKAHNWQIDRNTWSNDERYEEDLSKLINPSRSVVEVVYLKKVGDIECTLDFRYDSPFNNMSAAITINESCWHPINLFGGYV